MENTNRDLLEQLYQLEWLLRRYHMQHLRERGPLGAPYRGQGRILSLLKIKPEMSQKELAAILDIRSQSLGELLSKLEKSGYITRSPSTVDRRVMDISLTEAGKAASDKELDGPDPDSMFECLSAEEQTTLSNYLGRLIESLEKQLGKSGAEDDFRGRPDFGGDFRGRGFRGPHGRDGEAPFGRDFARFWERGNPRSPFGGRGPDDPPDLPPEDKK